MQQFLTRVTHYNYIKLSMKFTLKNCAKLIAFRNSFSSVLVSTIKQAIRTVAFHNSEESEPFLTTNNTCFPSEFIQFPHLQVKKKSLSKKLRGLTVRI